MHAALREKLFASVVHLLGNRWHCVSDKKKNDCFLTGISQDDLIQFVQSFISMSNHFCKLLFLLVCFVRSSRVKVFFSLFFICIVNQKKEKKKLHSHAP